jgi:hypothetical protein
VNWKPTIIISSILFTIAVAIYVNSRLIKEITFSDEVLASLPGCKVRKEKIDMSRVYTEEELEKMQKNAKLCFDSKTKYLRSNKNPKGVSYKYVFEQ